VLRVAAFTGGVNEPSARFRVRQYIPRLCKEGIKIHEMPARFGAYPPRAPWRRPLWGVASLAVQIPNIVASRRYDVVMFQREMVSTLVTLEPWMKQPRVLDVDDAIFLFRGGKAARHLAELSDLIICGNSFLADWFSQWNRNIVIIPTAVDSERFVPQTELGKEKRNLIIGWIGTSSNLGYLVNIEPALARVMGQYPQLRLSIISDRVPELRLVPPERVDFHRWSEKIEVVRIQRMDIGIMPMEDATWTRGKCAFKMLQYMSCGIPVVVSPVGMNNEILALGEVGFAAETTDQWVNALSCLLSNKEQRLFMGENGRKIVLDRYSIDVVAPNLGAVLLQVAKSS
jgi:glycosyltransferase involved in cell wall biosynthesis